MKELQMLFPEMAKKSREEAGNLQYEGFPAADDSKFYIIESYKDAQAVSAHKTSKHYEEIVVQQVNALLEKKEIYRLEKIQ